MFQVVHGGVPGNLYYIAADRQRSGLLAPEARVLRQWQLPDPESVNDFPASGMNFQSYPSTFKVSFKTPNVLLFRISLFAL